MLTRRSLIRNTGVPLMCTLVGGSCIAKSNNWNNSNSSSVDDTMYLQGLLDNGGEILLDPIRTYRVSPQPDRKFALQIGSNTNLDLMGSTIELLSDRNCSLLSAAPGTRITNVRVVNGVLKGNGLNQAARFEPGQDFTPTVYLVDCDELELSDLRIDDAYMYAAYVRGNKNLVKNIDIEGAKGGGLHLNGANWEIQRINVKNINYLDDINCQGNPFIVSLTDSTIGEVRCVNYGFGIKFQDGCRNLTIHSIEAVAGNNNCDFLVKIQGLKRKNADRPNDKIAIKNIVAIGGPYSGLYIFYSDNVRIDSYCGSSNGSNFQVVDRKNRSDTLIISSNEIHFKKFRADAFPRHALWLGDGAGLVSADEISINGLATLKEDECVIQSGKICFGRADCEQKR